MKIKSFLKRKMSSSKIFTRINSAPLASIESTNDAAEVVVQPDKLIKPIVKAVEQSNKNPCAKGITDTTSSSNNNNINGSSNCCNKQKDEGTKLINLDPNFEYKGYYKFGKILGKGSFGTVIECVRKVDERPIAMKFFKYKAIHKWIAESAVSEHLDGELVKHSEFFSNTPAKSNRMLPSEVACLIRAHKIDGTVNLLDYIPASDEDYESVGGGQNATVISSSCSSLDSGEIYDESIIGIVLERDPHEMCFFDYLVKHNTLNEQEARVIMKQLVEINLNLLQNGILHGDLKSENILINPETKKIKLIDFGSAQIIDNGTTNTTTTTNVGATNTCTNGGKQNSLHKCNTQSSLTKLVRTFRGTNLYKPPEYILHRCFYPRPSTVWTFGIILYDMVCGNFPFDKDSDILTHQDKEINFTRIDLTDNLKDLIKRCLAFYVADRIVIEKVLNHPWMMKDC